MASDIDLVVLTREAGSYVLDSGWIGAATGSQRKGRIVRTRRWGPMTERRVELASGLHVEFGFVPLSWAGTDPPDVGTARVVSDGFRILFDPDGVLHRLVVRVLG
jgi:hypothetical protein